MVLFVHMFAFISTQHDSYISQAVNNQSHLITEPWHLTQHTFSSLLKSSGVSELLSGPSTKIVHIKQVNRATHQEGHLQRFSLSDFGMVVHHTEYKCQSYHYLFTDAPCTKDNVEFEHDRTAIGVATSLTSLLRSRLRNLGRCTKAVQIHLEDTRTGNETVVSCISNAGANVHQWNLDKFGLTAYEYRPWMIHLLRRLLCQWSSSSIGNVSGAERISTFSRHGLLRNGVAIDACHDMHRVNTLCYWCIRSMFLSMLLHCCWRVWECLQARPEY